MQSETIDKIIGKLLDKLKCKLHTKINVVNAAHSNDRIGISFHKTFINFYFFICGKTFAV